MLKNSENNGTEEIGLVTPTPGTVHVITVPLGHVESRFYE